jgi:hypothetical protein
MVLFTGLVVFALLVAVVKQIVKRGQKQTANKPKRHLRLVDED